MKYYPQLFCATFFLCSTLSAAAVEQSPDAVLPNPTMPSVELTEYLNIEGCDKDLGSLSVGDCLDYEIPETQDGTYTLVNGSVGMHVGKHTGHLRWVPTSNQVGDHSISVEVRDSDGNFVVKHDYTVTVSAAASQEADAILAKEQGGFFVVPGVGADVDGNGTADKPFNTIEFAAQKADNQEDSTIYIRGGTYNLTAKIKHVDNITLRPWGKEMVTINHLKGSDTSTLELNRCNDIKIRFLELIGGGEDISFEEVVTKYFWRSGAKQESGKFGLHIHGNSNQEKACKNILVEGNVIHGYSQKAIEVEHIHNTVIRNNIIHSINWNTLANGHALMRFHPQRGNENEGKIGDDFTLNVTLSPGKEDEYLTQVRKHRHRTDVIGNLVFDVYQRIYSWGGGISGEITDENPAKKLVNDEGNSIMIEDSPDTYSRTRVAHNLVLWGKGYGISINSTPNLEVLNNTIVKNDGGPFKTSNGLFFKGKHKGHLTMNHNVVYSYASSANDSNPNNDSIWDEGFPSGFRLQRLVGFKDATHTFEMKNNYQAGGGDVSGIEKLRHSGESVEDAIENLGEDGLLLKIQEESGPESAPTDPVVIDSKVFLKHNDLSSFKVHKDLFDKADAKFGVVPGVDNGHFTVLDNMVKHYGVEVKYSGYCDNPVLHMKLIIDSAAAADWQSATPKFAELEARQSNRGLGNDTLLFTWNKGKETHSFISPKGYVTWIAKTNLTDAEFETWVDKKQWENVPIETRAMIEEKIESSAGTPILPRDDERFNKLMKASGCLIN